MIPINHITIAGRLSQDPRIYEVGDQKKKLAKFGVAINRNIQTKNGKKRETTFIDVQAWEYDADFVEKHLKKGDCCVVDGELVSESWREKTGEFRSKIAVRSRGVIALRDAVAEETENTSAAATPPANDPDYDEDVAPF